MKILPALGAVALLGLPGCVRGAGQLDTTAFVQADYGYKVAYVDPKTKALAGADWTIDNFYVDKRGKWQPKGGADYQATREFDANGDGQIEFGERSTEYIYDVRLVNARDNGILWVKAHPVRGADAHRELDVVLNNYADGLAGAGLYAQSNLFNVEHVHERRFTTFVNAKQAVDVGGLRGLEATIELAETDKLQVDPSSRSEKVRIALLKLYFYESTRSAPGCGDRWPVFTKGKESLCRRPGLLMVGYANTADRFADHVADFEQLLQRISFEPGSRTEDDTPAPPSALAAPAASAGAQR